MKLYIKPGVLFQPLTPQMALANQIVTYVFDFYGYPTTITSGSDGVHNGAPVDGDALDPHYMGKALDYRTVAQGIPDAAILTIQSALQTALGAQYVVRKEASHIHVQFGHPRPPAAEELDPFA